MPTCSICGSSKERLVNSAIEGALVSVCDECAKFGNVVGPATENRKNIAHYIAIEEIEFIEDGFHNKVRKGRERKKLTQDELAKNLAEKVSTIHGIESGKLKPTIKLARKLEIFLGIDIISKEAVNLGENKKIDFKDKDVTIGDLLRMKDDN